MTYTQVLPARFLSRPNRFVAQVEVDGHTETVHVKNTGRCRELLIPGRTVYLTPGDNPKRKTPYDLIAVDKDGLLVNMDAQAPTRSLPSGPGRDTSSPASPSCARRPPGAIPALTSTGKRAPAGALWR